MWIWLRFAASGSEAMLGLAARRNAGFDNVEFIEADATSLPVAERSFDAALSVQVLAGRMQAADDSLRSALDAQADADRTHGEAWLVGAGPGDPELLSLRGFHLLQHADVVLHDRLIAPELLAFARRDAELIDVGKTGGGPGTSQATINALLLDRVRAGKRVCRLKGGDPYVFGRGSEEAAALAEAGLPFQVIPVLWNA